MEHRLYEPLKEQGHNDQWHSGDRQQRCGLLQRVFDKRPNIPAENEEQRQQAPHVEHYDEGQVVLRRYSKDMVKNQQVP